MAKTCFICDKTYNKANYVNKLRGQYNRCGTKIQKPNLQRKSINGQKQLVCTTCIKTMTKVRTPKKKAEKKA
jgi:hypothetical protein